MTPSRRRPAPSRRDALGVVGLVGEQRDDRERHAGGHRGQRRARAAVADHRRRVGHDRALGHPPLDVDVGRQRRRGRPGRPRCRRSAARAPARPRARRSRRGRSPGSSRCRPRRCRRRRRRAGPSSRPTSRAAGAARTAGARKRRVPAYSGKPGCSSERGASVRYGSPRAVAQRRREVELRAQPRHRRVEVEVALVEDGEEAGDVDVRDADASAASTEANSHVSRTITSGSQASASSSSFGSAERANSPAKTSSNTIRACSCGRRGGAHPVPGLGHDRLVGLVERPRTAGRRA